VREFLLTDHGIELIDAYIGSEGVLMGSARSSQLARETAEEVERRLVNEQKQLELRRKQQLYEAQLMTLQGQYESDRDAILRELEHEEERARVTASQRLEIARLRKADSDGAKVEENGVRKARKGTVR
jgi:circadian clock protein KaiC